MHTHVTYTHAPTCAPKGIAPDRDAAAKDDSAYAEAQLAQKQALFLRSVKERKAKLERAAAAVAAKQAENDEIRRHLSTLHGVLEDQSKLQDAVAAAEDVAGKKMRSLVTNKQLSDISKQQAADIGALQQELQQLQLRTFPSFMIPGMPTPGAPPQQHHPRRGASAPSGTFNTGGAASPAKKPGSSGLGGFGLMGKRSSGAAGTAAGSPAAAAARHTLPRLKS